MSACNNGTYFGCFFGDCINITLIDSSSTTSKYQQTSTSNMNNTVVYEYCSCWKGFTHDVLFLLQRNCSVPLVYYPIASAIAGVSCLFGLYKSTYTTIALRNHKRSNVFRVALHATLVNLFYLMLAFDIAISQRITPWAAVALTLGSANATFMGGNIVVVILTPIRQSIARSYSNKYDYVFEFWRYVFSIIAPSFVGIIFAICFGIAFISYYTPNEQLSDSVYYFNASNPITEDTTPGTVQLIQKISAAEIAYNNWMIGVLVVIPSFVFSILSLALWFAQKLILTLLEILPSRVKGKDTSLGRAPSPSMVSSIDIGSPNIFFSTGRHSDETVSRFSFLELVKPKTPAPLVREPSVPLQEDAIENGPDKIIAKTEGSGSPKNAEGNTLTETEQKRDKFLLDYIKSLRALRVFSLSVGIPMVITGFSITAVYFTYKEVPFTYVIINLGLVSVPAWTYKATKFVLDISSDKSDPDAFTSFRLRAQSKKNATKESNLTPKFQNRRDDTAPAPPTVESQERVFRGPNAALKSNIASSELDPITIDGNNNNLNHSKVQDRASFPNSSNQYISDNLPASKKQSLV